MDFSAVFVAVLLYAAVTFTVTFSRQYQRSASLQKWLAPNYYEHYNPYSILNSATIYPSQLWGDNNMYTAFDINGSSSPSDYKPLKRRQYRSRLSSQDANKPRRYQNTTAPNTNNNVVTSWPPPPLPDPFAPTTTNIDRTAVLLNDEPIVHGYYDNTENNNNGGNRRRRPPLRSPPLDSGGIGAEPTGTTNVDAMENAPWSTYNNNNRGGARENINGETPAQRDARGLSSSAPAPPPPPPAQLPRESESVAAETASLPLPSTTIQHVAPPYDWRRQPPPQTSNEKGPVYSAPPPPPPLLIQQVRIQNEKGETAPPRIAYNNVQSSYIQQQEPRRQYGSYASYTTGGGRSNEKAGGATLQQAPAFVSSIFSPAPVFSFSPEFHPSFLRFSPVSDMQGASSFSFTPPVIANTKAGISVAQPQITSSFVKTHQPITHQYFSSHHQASSSYNKPATIRTMASFRGSMQQQSPPFSGAIKPQQSFPPVIPLPPPPPQHISQQQDFNRQQQQQQSEKAGLASISQISRGPSSSFQSTTFGQQHQNVLPFPPLPPIPSIGGGGNFKGTGGGGGSAIYDQPTISCYQCRVPTDRACGPASVVQACAWVFQPESCFNATVQYVPVEDGATGIIPPSKAPEKVFDCKTQVSFPVMFLRQFHIGRNECKSYSGYTITTSAMVGGEQRDYKYELQGNICTCSTDACNQA